MIDYERAKRSNPRLKAALTRAKKGGYASVLDACKKAVREWDTIGAWPDGWRVWESALKDAAIAHRIQTGNSMHVQTLDQIALEA